MIINAKVDAKQKLSARSKRISKNKTPMSAVHSFLFKPIDDVIGQCVDMHKTLYRSHQILSDFSRELSSISAYLEQMRFEDHPDDLTVWDFGSEEPQLIDHRNLFARLSDDKNCSVNECTEEQFKKEISNIHNNVGSVRATNFSISLLDMTNLASPNTKSSKARISFAANGNDS